METLLPDNPEKPQRLASSAYGLAHAVVLPHLRQIAREHGYALAVHGSMATDLDLLACPWTEDAGEPEALIEAIREAIDGIITQFPKEGEKPHGRRAWCMIPARWISVSSMNGLKVDWRPWLDISVIPRQQPTDEDLTLTPMD